MEMFKPVILEDLKIYYNGLKKEEYSFCNVMSNRIITNAVILDSKIFVLIGAILKESLKYFNVSDEGKRNINRELINFVDKIIGTEDLKIEFVLDNLFVFYSNIRQYLSLKYEKYKENKDYSLFSTKFCLNFLKAELEDQKVPYELDLLFSGISSELGRIYRNFGCTSHQLILYIVIDFSGRLYDYYRIIMFSEESKRSHWEKKFLKIKEEIKKNIESFDFIEDYISNSIDLLLEICREWRYMFLRIMEIVPQVKDIKTIISSEVKEDLKGMASKMIEKEIKGE